jgi:hypothetical protein
MTDWKGLCSAKPPEAHLEEEQNKNPITIFQDCPNRRNRCCQLRVHYLRGNDLEACLGVHTCGFANSHFPLKDSLDQKVEENYTPRV